MDVLRHEARSRNLVSPWTLYQDVATARHGAFRRDSRCILCTTLPRHQHGHSRDTNDTHLGTSTHTKARTPKHTQLQVGGSGPLVTPTMTLDNHTPSNIRLKQFSPRRNSKSSNFPPRHISSLQQLYLPMSMSCWNTGSNLFWLVTDDCVDISRHISFLRQGIKFAILKLYI